MDANSTFLRRKISAYKLPNILSNGKMERVRITINTGLFKVEALTEVPGNPRDPISKAELDLHRVTKLGTKNLLSREIHTFRPEAVATLDKHHLGIL